MRLSVRKVGNSKGLIVPKAMLDQCQLGEAAEVEVEVVKGAIVIRKPKASPRSGWAEAFKAMAKAGDDKLVDQSFGTTQFDATHWQW